VVGGLNIAAGVVWLLALGTLVLVILGFSVGFGMPQGAALARLWAILLALSLPGLLAIAGEISSLKRRRWLLALIGSIGVIPAGLGIAAVILLLQSKNEFA
jgi:ABC-type transport system involved in multi-copper enzyme maturation permease subunit